MQSNPAKKTVWKKQIPTLLGLAVLVIALVAGIIFLPQGLGVFAPRATPQTTPKLVKLTNITDSAFTVSFLTDEAAAGFIKYGTTATALKSSIGDDRDQLSGEIGKYQLHHITIRGLSANTNYFYTIGTASNAVFDDNGQPFKVKTGQKSGTPAAAKTVYGTVLSKGGTGASGAIIYLTLSGVGEMSTLVKASGSWALPLSNARNADGSGYAEVMDNDQLEILVQGEGEAVKSQLSVTVAEAQPVGDLTLGENIAAAVSKSTSAGLQSGRGAAAASASPSPSVSPSPSPSPTASSAATTAASGLGALGATGTTASVSASSVLDLTATTAAQVLDSTTPLIKGKAASKVEVSITINSDTAITQTVTADAQGNFELDLAELKQTLEPGEHTLTYSYTDPISKSLVSKTVSFTVEGQVSPSPSPTPYGTTYPYTIGGATGSATATASASPSATATRSAKIATTSALPKSGAMETTLALVIGGLFFILAGAWSYFLSLQYRDE